MASRLTSPKPLLISAWAVAPSGLYYLGVQRCDPHGCNDRSDRAIDCKEK